MPIQFMVHNPKPNDTVAMGDNEVAWTTPINITIVSVSAAATADDTGALVQIVDDGTDVIANVDAHLTATPGTWLSTAVGGTNAPVEIAADSVIELDMDAFAVGVGCTVVIGYLPGVVY